jgi:hypothetical protein
MKLFKSLILALALCLPSFSSDLGFKGQLTSSTGLGFGGGAGVLGLIDITNVFSFYPSLDFWYNGGGQGQYWDGYYWVYEDSYYVYELAFNIDATFIIPLRPVRPYIGFGMAPVITSESWDYSYNEYTSVHAGFNIFGGILFPIGYSTSGMFEFRGKLGRPYNVFKISAGILFEPHIYYHRHHHREK